MSPEPAEPPTLDAEEERLWRNLGRVTQRLPRLLDDAMLRGAGLTMSEFAVLDAMGGSPEATVRMSDLAAEIGLSLSRVSRVVDKLAARGWCRRVRHGGDGRSALVVLTDDGGARVAAARPLHRRLAREHVLDRVPPADRDAVAAALAAIAEDRRA
ncbi:MarR family winged helix-turn-helix transcriptional regulator [Actinomycetospora termitidis]|uniref:MarR family transcriptional regulator n=1 Tax=Actinomycetospora termitidis TaxID=3053470 RepID=A0ABT7MDP6_9PSEU|nr:MarR family transcriptional regulator [Actinomycetospora sp. Odt1-22]MDL5158791.1 MarR family transcriptional regulator [Actinomycetospora sp. Odt1-22]